MEWDKRGLHLLNNEGIIIACKDQGPCSRCACKAECAILKGSGAIVSGGPT